MIRRIARAWPLCAAMAGCAQGAPLDTDGGATTAMTLVDMTTTTTETPPSTGPDETTDDTGGTTFDETSGTTEAETSGTTGTTGEPEAGAVLYPYGEIHSPITPEIADSIAAIAAAGPDKQAGVFSKIGGTTTASASFLHCLATPAMVVGLPIDLQPTLDFFNAAPAGVGFTSFNRASLAAMAGWTSAEPIAGMPMMTPLFAETTEVLPRYAVILLGTHDLALAQPTALFDFADNLVNTVDALIAGGTVPILSTIPERTDMLAFAPFVPRFNAVIRAVAQGRQVPLVDLNFALALLPTKGVAADGVDLDVYVDANMAAQPCDFMAGIAHGYNTRNLVTLQALGRALAAVEGEPAPNQTAPVLAGSGTLADPFQIPSLPFVDMRTTTASPSDAIDVYGTPTCPADIDESGPEYVYRLTVEADISLRAMVFDRAPVDVDLHLLTLADPKTCVKRDDKQLTGPLSPGTYYLVVDSFMGDVGAGEFALAVLTD